MLTGLPDFTPSPSLTQFDNQVGSSIVAGRNYNVPLSLQNLGTSSGTSSVRLYINDKLALDVPLTLNPGDLSATGYSWSPSIGTYIFRWVADEQNAVAESNETNNIVTKTVVVLPPTTYSLSAGSSSANESSTIELIQKFEALLFKDLFIFNYFSTFN